MATPLWFKIDKPATPGDISKPHSFDRHISLVNFWFDLFSIPVPVQITHNQDSLTSTIQTEEKLDYKNMVNTNRKILVILLNFIASISP